MMMFDINYDMTPIIKSYSPDLYHLSFPFELDFSFVC